MTSRSLAGGPERVRSTGGRWCEPARVRADLYGYRRGPPPRLWTAQAALAADLCPFPTGRTASTGFAHAAPPLTSLSTLIPPCPTRSRVFTPTPTSPYPVYWSTGLLCG